MQDTKNLKLSTGTYSFDKNGDPTSPRWPSTSTRAQRDTFVKQFAVGQ